LFELSCFQVSPSYHPLCDSLIFTPLSSSTVNHSSTVTTNDMFQIVMRGRSSLGNIADNRRCEKVIELSLLNSHAPLVTLEVLSGTKMNPSSKLKILGRVDMASSGKMKWTVNRRLSSSATSTPHNCSSDSDCNDSGLFLECNHASHHCQSIQQTCPNSCSGHGNCMFFSKDDPVQNYDRVWGVGSELCSSL
jgi:hypothetical protein